MLNKILKRVFNPEISGKKKNVVLGLLLITLFAFGTSLMAQTATPPEFGDGSSGNPYQIATLNNLYWITQNPSVWEEPGKYFIQTEDIDASTTSSWDVGAGFTPIGNDTDGFWGSYDGQDHTIDGLYINRPNTDFVGLFGRLQSATIQNLGVTNVNITGKIYTGGLVGFCIENSPVTNCYSTGIVNGYNTVGGLLGILNESPLSNSYSTVTVTGTDNYVGGLVGFFFENASISNCYSTGSVSGDVSVGGLVGVITLASTVSNSYSTGSVSGNESVGGLVGLNDNSTVSNSFWNTETSGQSGSDGGTPATTTQMTNATTTDNIFLNAGWDFKGVGAEGIWNIGHSRNNGYPYLDWQYPSDPATLPVTLSTFTAVFMNEFVTIQWATASETDVIGFNIYRSEQDDIITVGNSINPSLLDAVGNSTQTNEYSFDDIDAHTLKPYFYWLEVVNLDGTTELHGSIVYTPGDINGDNSQDVYMQNILGNSYPNPASVSTEISYQIKGSVTSQDTKIRVYNILGGLVKTAHGTDGRAVVDVSELSNGIYFYVLQTDSSYDVKKFIVFR